MDVRIGVIHTMKEIDLELSSDIDAEAVRAEIDSALAEEGRVLWLTDRNGRRFAVPSARIAYVELGPASERRMGFGA